MNTIKDFVTRRGITTVFHFTRIENLDSVLKHGLLPKDRLPEHAVMVNDEQRLDFTNAVCTSISFPNYRVFYCFRSRDKLAQWAVISLSACLLWETPCAFSVENAASSSVTAIPLAERMNVAALSAMFDDWGGRKRADLGIPDSFPTNPQAEVLLLQGASNRYIQSVDFMSEAHRARFRLTYPKLVTSLNRFFCARADYKHWKQHG